MIFCENGRFAYAGKTLKDHHPYGDLSVDDVLVKSSNIGAAKLAMMMGEQKFYEYIRRFGFGERTGVNLPGEINGSVHPPHQWTKISITRMPMGQGVGVTPMQTITAMSAIANGGHLMMPQIVHEIVDGQGATVATYPPVKIRDVVSGQVAAQVREALKNVVSERGTAVLAKVAGFTVAGKTGTAQKVNPNGGGYLKDKYIVSFVGFLPAENPEFVGLVLLDDAKTTEELNYGGQVAAPIFSRIAEKAARYMNLEPHPEDTPGIILTQSQR
jgi:cell division protein FtsI/penicillin-binding protein 2